MNLIRREWSELSVLYLKTVIHVFDFVYTLSSANMDQCGVCGREVERRPCNHEVPSSSPRIGSQLWDFSLAHTLSASTGVVPRKQNRERLV